MVQLTETLNIPMTVVTSMLNLANIGYLDVIVATASSVSSPWVPRPNYTLWP